MITFDKRFCIFTQQLQSTSQSIVPEQPCRTSLVSCDHLLTVLVVSQALAGLEDFTGISGPQVQCLIYPGWSTNCLKVGRAAGVTSPDILMNAFRCCVYSLVMSECVLV